MKFQNKYFLLQKPGRRRVRGNQSPMKWISSVVLLFLTSSVQLGLVAPTSFDFSLRADSGLVRRAVASDAADVGFATLNSGTTGGAGGKTTTVTTLAALTAAVKGDDKKIVIVSGELLIWAIWTWKC